MRLHALEAAPSAEIAYALVCSARQCPVLRQRMFGFGHSAVRCPVLRQLSSHTLWYRHSAMQCPDSVRLCSACRVRTEIPYRPHAVRVLR